MAQDYASVEAVADHLRQPELIESEDRARLLQQLVTRASRLIDAWFGYREGAWKAEEVASVRYYPGNNQEELWVDFMAVAPTQVEVSEDGDLTAYTVWAATDYYCLPLNALSDGRPYRSLKINTMVSSKPYWFGFGDLATVKITCRWGWSTILHPMIEEACIVQTARWYKRGEQAFQDAGAVTELMDLRYLKKIDPEIELLLSRMPGGITI